MTQIYKATEMSETANLLKPIVDDLSEYASKLEQGYASLVQDESFEGEYAIRVKTYYNEVQIKISQAIKSLVKGLYSTSLRMQQEAISMIDSSGSAFIEKEIVEDCISYSETALVQLDGSIMDLNNQIQDTAAIVSSCIGEQGVYAKYDNTIIFSLHCNVNNALKNVKESIENYDTKRVDKTLDEFLDSVNKLMEYRKEIAKKGIQTYQAGDIGKQPWINDFTTRLTALEMVNRFATYTPEELTAMTDAQIKAIVTELYGMDESELTYLASVYGFEYNNPKQQAIFLRELVKLMNLIDRNGNPKEKEFFDAMANQKYELAFNIPYKNLSIATIGLLDNTILSFQTRPIDEFQGFLQAMLKSETDYNSSPQSMYLVHTFETVKSQQELNYNYARVYDIPQEEINRLTDQNNWLFKASGLLGALITVALNSEENPTPAQEILDSKSENGITTTKSKVYAGIEISDLGFDEGYYKFSYQSLAREVTSTFRKTGEGDYYFETSELIDKEWGDVFHFNKGREAVKIQTSSTDSTKAYHEFQERMKEINKKRNEIIEDQIISFVNSASYLGGPKLVLATSFLTSMYKLITKVNIDNMKETTGSIIDATGDEFKYLKNSKALTNFIFETYGNIDELNKLSGEEREALDKFMEEYLVKGYIRHKSFTNEITNKNIESEVVSIVYTDIENAVNVGRLERAGLDGIYVEEAFKLAFNELEIEYSKKGNEAKKKILDAMRSPEGFQFDDIYSKDLPEVLADVDGKITNGLEDLKKKDPTLVETYKNRESISKLLGGN